MSNQADRAVQLDAVVTAIPRQVSCDLDDETVVLSLADGVYYGLNPVATRVWHMLQERPSSVREICERLCEEYDVEEDQCVRDVRALVEQLSAWSLVEVGAREETR